MSKKISFMLAVVLVASLLLSACGTTGGDAFKVCQVTDAGGIDDKSFNATAWKGIQDAEEEMGIEAKYLESQPAPGLITAKPCRFSARLASSSATASAFPSIGSK